MFKIHLRFSSDQENLDFDGFFLPLMFQEVQDWGGCVFTYLVFEELGSGLCSSYGIVILDVEKMP